MDFLVTQGQYLGIICFLILTGCGLPIPEEVPIVLAGVLSARGTLHPGLAYLCCIVGALVGDAVMYAIGYHWGHGLVAAHPRFAKFVRADREERFEEAIRRHGFKVLLLARFMVGVRGPVYLAAGVMRISFRRFILIDLVAATLVVSLFFGLSYAYGETVARLLRNAEVALTVVVLLSLAVVLAIVYWRRQTFSSEIIDPPTSEAAAQQEDADDAMTEAEDANERREAEVRQVQAAEPEEVPPARRTG